MSIRLIALVAVFFVLAAACGNDNDPYIPPGTNTPETAEPTAEPGTATPAPPVTELRAVFINLLHPLPLDPENLEADQTLEQRLAVLIPELQALQPDFVAVVESSWTEAHGSVTSTLAGALQMEYKYEPANPWLPNLSAEQLKELADVSGFEEGVAVLSRYPILSWETHQVTPRPSQTENRIVLHAVVKGPDPVGEMDLYVTQFTGGTDFSRAEQAADVVQFIGETRGMGRPVLFFADLNEAPGSLTEQAFTAEGGFVDVVAAAQPPLPEGTCCRLSVLGAQPPLPLRTAYIMTSGWSAASAALVGAVPYPTLDGTPLYVSDQNGLSVVFDLNNLGPALPPVSLRR